jgi:diguanylate cyclase (GGDEF)-like protein
MQDPHWYEKVVGQLEDLLDRTGSAVSHEEACHFLASGLVDLFGAASCFVVSWNDPGRVHPLLIYADESSPPTVIKDPPINRLTAQKLLSHQGMRPGMLAATAITRYLMPPLVARHSVGAVLLLPINRESPSTTIVTLLLFSEPRQLDTHEWLLAYQLSHQVARALATRRALEKAEERVAEVETLREAMAAVTATLEQDVAIERILEQLHRVVPYDSATVQLLRDSRLEVVGGRGWGDPQAIQGRILPVPGDNPDSQVVQQRRPILLRDARRSYSLFRSPPHEHIGSWLGVPLVVYDKVIGVLALDRSEPAGFSQDHVRLVADFADHVAVVLEHARLYEAQQERGLAMEALHDSSVALLQTLDLSTLLDQVTAAACNLVVFDERDLQLLDTFAASATTAIANAQLHMEIQQLAVTDALTGLYNRRGFYELAAREIELSRRTGRCLLALLMDIDHFKEINDRFGHAVGDQILRQLAEVCPQELRVSDLVGRVGGEEFAVLLPEVVPASAYHIAERLRLRLAEVSLQAGDETVRLTVSMGLAMSDATVDNLETLLQRADQALYEAKRAGRNRIHIWNEGTAGA